MKEIFSTVRCVDCYQEFYGGSDSRLCGGCQLKKMTGKETTIKPETKTQSLSQANVFGLRDFCATSSCLTRPYKGSLYCSKCKTKFGYYR